MLVKRMHDFGESDRLSSASGASSMNKNSQKVDELDKTFGQLVGDVTGSSDAGRRAARQMQMEREYDGNEGAGEFHRRGKKEKPACTMCNFGIEEEPEGWE